MIVRTISSKIAFFYCVLTLFMLAFVNYEGAIGLNTPIRAPYIHGQVIILHSFISGLLFLVMIFIRPKSIALVDLPICCLFVKCFLDVLPVFMGLSDVSDYFAHWACTLTSLISYFLIVKSNLNQTQIDRLKIAILVFGIILSLQVVYTFLLIDEPYYSLYYKGEMLIPYGATNVIASAIVPIICICYYSNINYRFKWTIISVMVLAIILTKSRGGMMLALATILLLLYIKEGKSNKIVIQRFLLIVLALWGIATLLNNEMVRLILRGFASDNDNLDANSLSSGRIGVWMTLFSEMKHMNILTGIGMKSLAGNESGAHNLIIDLIYKCGIIGTINYSILLYYILKRGLREYKAYNRELFLAVCIMLFNMMYEVNYFSYSCDCFFWIIAGLMMKEYYMRRSIIVNYNRSHWNI